MSDKQSTRVRVGIQPVPASRYQERRTVIEAFETTPASLPDLAILFLRLGFTAFGGPAAHIALMRKEVVDRRKWLTQSQFLDFVGASNLLPGPGSTEVAIFIGYTLGGAVGMAAAGICFIVPAAVIVCLLAELYRHLHGLHQTAGVLYGMKPIVIAIVVQALVSLGRTALKSRTLMAVSIAAFAAAVTGIHPLSILLAAGATIAVLNRSKLDARIQSGPILALIGIVTLFASTPSIVSRFLPPGGHILLPALFAVFLKLGSVVYGSGYVLLVFLKSDFITRRGWLTMSQLLDATAIGQITPGPVFTTATFIGYILGGIPGAGLATVAIFLPAFLFVAISGKLVPQLRRSRVAGSFMDGINASAVALMAAVTFTLARDAIRDVQTVGLTLISAVLLLRFKVNATVLIIGGAFTGLLLYR